MKFITFSREIYSIFKNLGNTMVKVYCKQYSYNYNYIVSYIVEFLKSTASYDVTEECIIAIHVTDNLEKQSS